jgi:anti-sigma factor (TIGR02949 family)
LTPRDSLSCREVFLRLNDYVDRELSPEETRLVAEHLAACAWCMGEYRFETTVVRSVRSTVARISAPDDLRKRVLFAFGEDAAGGG